MRILFLLFNLVFLAASYAAVSYNNANENVKNSRVPLPAESATMAPLVTSTTASKIEISSSNPLKVMSTMEKDLKIESLPIKMPATVEHSLQAVESKPLAVTGFITMNGSIYEIEDKNGFGKIQSRQALEEGRYICNYGAVVIYSDIPCEKVTTVKVTKVDEKPVADQSQDPASVLKQETQSTINAENNDLEEEDEEKEDRFVIRQKQEVRPNKNTQKRPNKNTQKRPTKKPARRPNKNTQKRPNKKPQKRPNKNTQKRPNKNTQKRPNKNTQKRPNKKPQKRPNKNTQKRPNKKPQQRPSKNTQKQPIKDVQEQPENTINNNFRRWEEELLDDYEGAYDDYEPYYQIRRRQYVEPYSSGYEYN